MQAKNKDRLANVTGSDCRYDYTNQAWVVDGRYVPCSHVGPCDCFGTAHAGEPVRADAEVA